MEILMIVLVVIGIIAIIVSFVITGKEEKTTPGLQEEHICYGRDDADAVGCGVTVAHRGLVKIDITAELGIARRAQLIKAQALGPSRQVLEDQGVLCAVVIDEFERCSMLDGVDG